MKTSVSRVLWKKSRKQLSRWVWLLAIFLVACAPAPMPAASSGEAAVGATDTPPSVEEATPEPTTTVVEEPTPSGSGAGVAILVVDFFSKLEEISGDNSNNCLASPTGATSEGAGSHGSTGANNDVVSTDERHGELVYAHLLQIIPNSDTFTDITPAGINGLVLAQQGTVNGSDFFLAKIDIGDNLTNEVLTKIDDARVFLQGKGAIHFVVNMSVVIKPCGSSFESFEEYLQFVECIPALAEQRQFMLGVDVPQATVDDILLPRADVTAAYYVNPLTREPLGCPGAPEDPNNPGVVPESLQGVQERSIAFVSRLVEDPLRQATQDGDGNPTTEDTFYVAASGNDGYDYPYAPAIFRQIVSTGSQAIPGVSIGYVPNGAEWILDDHFDWTVPAGVDVKVAGSSGNVTANAGEVVTLGGTSFATPKLSYLTALALIDGTTMPSCYPKMVYAADFLDASWDDWSNPPSGAGLVGSDIWQNMPLTELELACPGFLP